MVAAVENQHIHGLSSFIFENERDTFLGLIGYQEKSA